MDLSILGGGGFYKASANQLIGAGLGIGGIRVANFNINTLTNVFSATGKFALYRAVLNCIQSAESRTGKIHMVIDGRTVLNNADLIVGANLTVIPIVYSGGSQSGIVGITTPLFIESSISISLQLAGASGFGHDLTLGLIGLE